MLGFLRKGWIGIDIGSQSIKLAQVERRSGQTTMTDGVVVPRRSRDDDVGEPQLDTNRLAEDLHAALDLCPAFSGRKAACVLSMDFQDLRTFSLPHSSEPERRQMLAGELAAVGVNTEDYVFDSWIGLANGEDAQEVNVISVRRRLVEDIAKAISRVGLECQVIDGLPFTMARTPGTRGTYLAVDWGYSHATFCLVSSGYPQYCRATSGCPLKGMRLRIQEGLQLTEDEVTYLLQENGFPCSVDGSDQHPIQTSVADLAANVVSDFCQELDKTLNYITARTPFTPQYVHLQGYGATIRNAGAFLQSKSQHPLSKTIGATTSKASGTLTSDVPTPLLENAMAVSSLCWA